MNNKNNQLNLVRRQIEVPLFVFFATLLLAAPYAQANWRISPEIGLGVEYDNNSRLSDVEELSSSDSNYAIDARAIFLYDQQLTDFSITPRLRSRRYSDNSDLDADDQFLRINFAHDRQKASWGFRGDYASESVRTAERSEVDFDIEDPTEIPADETGRVFFSGKRDRLSLAPEFSYKLSQRVGLGIDAEYRDTSYDNVLVEFLNGFKEYDISASLRYSWSQRDTVSLIAGTGKYEADRSDFNSTSNSYGVGYNRKVSERTQLRMGASNDTSEDQFGDNQSNLVGEISVIHRYETTRVIASYQRRVNGSGFGGLAVRDAVSMNLSRDLSPKLNLSAGVRAYSTRALDSADVDFNAQDYAQFRARARWRYSREIAFALDYRYTNIDRKIDGEVSAGGDSNQVGLWIYWQPNPLPR